VRRRCTYRITPSSGENQGELGQISYGSPQLTPAQDCERKRKFHVPDSSQTTSCIIGGGSVDQLDFVKFKDENDKQKNDIG